MPLYDVVAYYRHPVDPSVPSKILEENRMMNSDEEAKRWFREEKMKKTMNYGYERIELIRGFRGTSVIDTHRY